LLGVTYGILNVHGGITESDVTTFLENEIDRSRNSSDKPHWVFFDEINTCDSVGLFKEVLCDRTVNGKPIPNNLVLLAAANPYRLRDSLQHQTGLSVFKHKVSTEQQDPLVRVHDDMSYFVGKFSV
jgi:hypothetical protein